MAINESLIQMIPQELIGRLGFLITIMQALGWAVIFYIVFSIVNIIIGWTRKQDIKIIIRNLEEIKMLLKSNLSK